MLRWNSLIRVMLATLCFLFCLTVQSREAYAVSWTPQSLTPHVGTKTGSIYTLGTTVTGNIYWMFGTAVSPGQYIRGSYAYTGNYPSVYFVFADGWASTLATGWTSANGVQVPSGHGNLVGLRTYTSYTYAITSMSVEFTGSPPPAPTGLQATSIGSTSVGLAWNAVTGATSYKVYKGNLLIASGLTSTNYTVSGLQMGTQYVFYVSAVNENGEGPQSAPLTVTTSSPPAAPTGLAATNLTPNSFTLTWATVTGAAKYEVFKDRTSVGITTSTSYNFTGLDPLSMHVYTVRAISSDGLNSPMSADLWVQQPDLPVTPSPTHVRSSGQIWGSGSITWTPGAGTPAGTVYSVYQSGQLLGTTTSTTFPLSNYNPAYPYTVSAQAPGWKPSPQVSDSPYGTFPWGFDALDLLNNSLALIVSVGGILLLVLTFMFAPSLVRFVRSTFKRNREDETLVYEPVQYRTDDDYTARYTYAGAATEYKAIDYADTTTDTTADLETDVQPRVQRAIEDYSTTPSRLDTHVTTDVSSRATTDRVRSDIGTYRFEY
jgi:hypothetical protein